MKGSVSGPIFTFFWLFLTLFIFAVMSALLLKSLTVFDSVAQKLPANYYANWTNVKDNLADAATSMVQTFPFVMYSIFLLLIVSDATVSLNPIYYPLAVAVVFISFALFYVHLYPIVEKIIVGNVIYTYAPTMWDFFFSHWELLFIATLVGLIGGYVRGAMSHAEMGGVGGV